VLKLHHAAVHVSDPAQLITERDSVERRIRVDRRRPGERSDRAGAEGPEARPAAAPPSLFPLPVAPTPPPPAPPGATPGQRPQQINNVAQPAQDTGSDLHESRRKLRLRLQEILWKVSMLTSRRGKHPVRDCGRIPRRKGGNVTVMSGPGGARFAGFLRCMSVWSCPVCMATILDGRAREISRGVGSWIRAGNSAIMGTVTFPHDAGMDLAPLLDMVADTFRYILADHGWRKLKADLRIAGQIRALELTHGRHGWHPHLHLLVLIEGEIPQDALGRLGAFLYDKWNRMVMAQGFRRVDPVKGIKVEQVQSGQEAGLYIAKVADGHSLGMEMGRPDLKSGRMKSRTPLEILGDYANAVAAAETDGGELPASGKRDIALWHEYEQATQGRQAITWSKGLHELLGVTARTDEELVKAEETGDDEPEPPVAVAVIPDPVRREMVKVPGLRATVLDAAETNGLDGINVALALHGIGPALPPPGSGNGLSHWDAFEDAPF